MKEYIERDNFYNIEPLLMTDIVQENPVAKNILEQVLFDIKEVPAADVKEVVHAKWIWKDFNYDGFHTLCCSECFGTEGARESANYCSECGARMDLY